MKAPAHCAGAFLFRDTLLLEMKPLAYEEEAGQIIILNGAPQSGKSSIVAVIQDEFDGLWMNMGVDRFMQMTPARFLPGIGLRPGGEHRGIGPLLLVLYGALYESIAAHSRLGLNVVVDVGHHEGHASRDGILMECARRLSGLPVLFVGVRCPIEIIMERRRDTGWNMDDPADAPVPRPVQLWQQEVHIPGIYDLEVDTSVLTAGECAEAIRRQIGREKDPTAFQRLAAMSTLPG